MKEYVVDKAAKYTEISIGEEVISDVDNIITEIFRRNDRNNDQLLGPAEFHMPLPSSSAAASNKQGTGRDEL